MSENTLLEAVQAWDAKQTQEEEQKATMAARFVNSNLSSKYIFKDGSEAIFVGGEYLTTDGPKFLELMAEIKANHPTIRQEVGKEFVDLRYVDPIEAIKKKAVDDYKASIARATEGSLDAGDSPAGPLEGIANSANVAAAFAGSTSGEAIDNQGTAVDTTVGKNTATLANPALAALAAKAAAAKASN